MPHNSCKNDYQEQLIVDLQKKTFTRNVEKLFNQMCSQEVREEYIANRFLIISR